MKDTNDDLSLIQQVAELHDKTAFDRLVRKYQSPIRRFFLHQTLGDAQLSDDLAQDTFIRAYTSIGTFRGSAAFSTWLFRIAYNVFYDYRHRLRPSADDLDAVCPAAAGADRSLGMDVYGALARLRHATARRRLSHRTHRRNNGHGGGHGEVASLPRKAETYRIPAAERIFLGLKCRWKIKDIVKIQSCYD